ncbi:MAG: bifunctional oligoribonuclease/PAP phosphatase NrnA [Longimicrobiales bacterium]
MSYSTPPHRLGPVHEILNVLAESRCVLLTTHVNADGDGVGCQAALASWLRARGKEAWIVNPTPVPDSFDFLLPDGSRSLDPGSGTVREVLNRVDLAVVLDTGEGSRIGRVMDLIRDLPRVIVDHHPPGPDPISGLSLRDPGASATGELLFDLLKEAGSLTREAALGIYVAILTDTGSFRFSNASPDAHRLVAELLELGVDPEETYRRVYGNLPLRKLRLLEAALAELEVDPSGRVAWMTVPTGAFEALSATSADLEGLVDYPREIQGVQVGLLFREVARGGTKVSFRSNGEVDVNALAGEFGGGGHRKAAGALLEGPLPEVRERVLEATREAVRVQLEEETGGTAEGGNHEWPMNEGAGS